MTSALQKRLRAYRAQTFRTAPDRRIASIDQAVSFVDERGFVFFWPIKDVTLPSLWAAAAGDRPVADAHDDPGHITWGWKDALLGKRRWYYAKVLRKKSTMISLAVAPYFYALSENFGSPEEDYLLQYEQGLLSLDAKAIYEALLREGPTHTVQLRRAAGMTNRDGDYRFNRALLELESDFKVLPIGVAQAGAWRYSFIEEIVARHYPQLPEQARAIGQGEARRKLAELVLRSVGAARAQELVKLFGWKIAAAERALGQLAEEGIVRRGIAIPDQPGDWAVIAELA
ncbi:MAG: winged helix DNA-binding domain-containing protein [Chloroflexi bacterium]|nr:winged helix DNA-binding domain-containing protein [Chloroflexota bacterium]